MPPPRSPARAVTVALGLAIFVAPFLAWLYSAQAGLAVMAASLAALAYLVAEATGRASAGRNRALQVVLVIDLALALACLGALVWLTVGG